MTSPLAHQAYRKYLFLPLLHRFYLNTQTHCQLWEKQPDDLALLFRRERGGEHVIGCVISSVARVWIMHEKRRSSQRKCREHLSNLPFHCDNATQQGISISQLSYEERCMECMGHAWIDMLCAQMSLLRSANLLIWWACRLNYQYQQRRS